MLISCPECHFKRHVDEKQIPESATLATCPKCQNKFRFRDTETGDFLPEICIMEEKLGEIVQPEIREGDNSVQITSDKENPEQENRREILAEQADQETVGQENQETNQEIKDFYTKLLGVGQKEENAEEKTQDNDDPVPLAEPVLEGKDKDSPLHEPPLQRYEQAEKKRAERYVMMTDDVPWEHPERYGIVGSLLQTVARVMFRGKEFFSTIHSQVSSLRPASFYALIGLFQALVAYFFSPNVMEILQGASIGANLDPQQQALVENLLSEQSLPMLLVSTPFIMIIQLIIYTAFVYLAIRITNPEKADFPLTLRIIAYASAPMVLSVVPYIGGVVGLVWFIYNIFIGIKYAMRLTWQRTFLALAPIFILWLFIAFNQALMIINTLQG